MTVEMKRNINKTKGHSKVINLVIALALVLSFSMVTTVPALAAPVVASVTETAFGTATTDHYVNMPATVNTGDLLIVLFTNDRDATVTIPGGWTELASDTNVPHVRLSVYYKIAGGTEGGTTVNFVTSAAEEAAAQVYRITDWHGTTPPEISTAAIGTSTAPNSASLDPAGWDVANTLWLVVAGQDRGDQSGTMSYPAGYTDGTCTLSSGGIGSCRTHSARRVLAAASVNPGANTLPVSEQWVAFTIAVRPAPHDLTSSSTGGGSVTEPGEDTFTYDDGTVVDLVAEANENYRFVEWTGDLGTIVDVYAATTTITMNGDYSITANFEEVPPPLVYPAVTTQAATGISTSSATLNMEYSMGSYTTVDVRFAYKKSADSAWSYTAWVSKTADGTDAESLTELNSNIEYDFTAQLKYNDTLEGTTLQFTTTTPSTPPPSGSGCFIATAAYGTSTTEQIDVLREFRDVVLLESTVGSKFVVLYYQLSPPVADFISGNNFLRTLIRELLIDPIVWVVEATGDIWQN
jgi:hypothetical protein